MIPQSIMRQATLLERGRKSRKVADQDMMALAGIDDVMELARVERGEWQERLRQIKDPVASRQYYRELLGEPPVANQTQIAVAADTVLWDAATLTPLAANSVRAGQIFKVSAFGVATTANTAAQTVIATPRFGTAVGGTSLGASRTAPVNAVVKTNIPWFLQMWVHFRSIGATGAAVCGGTLDAESIIGTAATTNTATLTFGINSATAIAVNTTVAAGLVVSLTPSHNTQTYTCMGVAMEALN